MIFVAAVLAGLAIALGAYGTTQAGFPGIASIALGCLLGILARLAQSQDQQWELVALLRPAATPPQRKEAPITTKTVLHDEVPSYEAQGWRVTERRGMAVTVTREQD